MSEDNLIKVINKCTKQQKCRQKFFNMKISVIILKPIIVVQKY